MCAKRGVKIPWDFNRYFQIAEKGGTLIRDTLYAEFSELYAQEPNWAVLYEEKRKALYAIVEGEKAKLLPGVEHLLTVLAERNIPRAIVTHSPRKLIEDFALNLPILKTISVWVCREDYKLPKPNPDGYLKALELFHHPKRVLGFEDAVRGIEALQSAKIPAVLVGHKDSATRAFWKSRGVIIIDRVDEILGIKDLNER